MFRRDSLTALLFIVGISLGCGFGDMLAKRTSPDNTAAKNLQNSNSSNAAANANTDPYGAPSESDRVYKVMSEKANEIGKTPTTVKLNSRTPINGKLAIVNQKYSFSEDFYIEGFNASGSDFALDYDLDRWGIKRDEIAGKPDEIDTLVRISCKRGKKIGEYTSGGKSIPAISLICEVELIDYKTAVVFAKRTFTNNDLFDTITTSTTQKEYVNLQPDEEIGKYLKKFPRG